jgi:hypothetical protein
MMRIFHAISAKQVLSEVQTLKVIYYCKMIAMERCSKLPPGIGPHAKLSTDVVALAQVLSMAWMQYSIPPNFSQMEF